MKYLFINYPKCTTCIKARKWLEENNIDFESRHIVENKPTKAELEKWINSSGMPLEKFFNTSGTLYRELGLKDRIKSETRENLLELLASNGLLVKRPLLISENTVIVGFSEDKYKAIL